MKCGYNYCKLGGDVKKEDSIKDGRYYHKECHEKKTVKKECRELLLENFKFMSRNINNAIKQLVDDKDINVNKLKFTIEYIIKNKSELNSPYGLGYYLENYQINDEFKKHQRLEDFKEVKKQEVDVKTVDETRFDFTKGGKKSWEIL